MLSIITPVLNGNDFILDNIKSIQKLTIPFEHIVVDGGSTDGTIETVKLYPHIKLVSQKKEKGMYGAINEGVKISRGDYLCYLNCDDRFTGGIENLYSKITSSNIDLIYGDALFFFSKINKTQSLKAAPFGRFFLKEGILPFCQSSSIFSKKAYIELGGFRSNIFKICGDLDFFQRIALRKDFSIKYLPVTSSIFLKHGNSLMDRSETIYNREILLINGGNKAKPFTRVLFKLSKLIPL